MSKKQMLLQTAAHMIREDGISQLSLERLAMKTGITKAGVLYHFDNKANLLRQMNELAIETFERRISDHLSDGPYPFTRAYALATLDDVDHGDMDLIAVFISSQEDAISESIWRAVSGNWDERFAADGPDQDAVLNVRLLCDGLWFAASYGYSDSFKERAATLIHEACDALHQGDA
ncbi:TetR/AcrR family transcriptional regulator [Exiguobacterium qingdaonense]|uniref:TetR/AcrR family transcriptional regulator n=1 Tax=Exiguobacterium qingdaonense TaxID=2751251 RepID=UPI001BEACABD|nr:TetR family transcriptional regulator [Exiguobacterium qingdaonense]